MIKKLILGSLLITSMNLSVLAQNSALSFNGTADYVQVVNANQLNFSSELTAEAWVQLDKTSGQNIIFSKAWCGISQFAYNLSILDGKLRWAWNIDGNCNFTALEESDNIVFQNGDCHHIAVVHSSSNVLLYVDGQVVPSTLVQGSYSGIMSSSEPLRMGIYRGLSGSFMYYMDGQLDELKFWSVTRSSQEINYSMQNVLQGNESNLVAYYDFENLVAGSFITVPNKAISTGNSLDATSSSTSPLIVSSCAQLSGIQDIENNSNDFYLQIAPNPAFNSIHVTASTILAQSQLYVFDAFGNVVISQPFSGTQTDVNISNLSTGFYYMQCDQMKGKVYKFVKN